MDSLVCILIVVVVSVGIFALVFPRCFPSAVGDYASTVRRVGGRVHVASLGPKRWSTGSRKGEGGHSSPSRDGREGGCGLERWRGEKLKNWRDRRFGGREDGILYMRYLRRRMTLAP